ncbi:MAG: O-antigen ligase family protein [Anaerolineales bacterium]|nr:O-antigen ligase family protein [Anaerolineales bacterium]
MQSEVWLERSQRFLWAFFLIALPVTNFRYFPSGFGGSTQVRPLSLYPLLGLLLIVVLPRLLKKPLPGAFLPLLLFSLSASASSVLALNRPVLSSFEFSVTDRVIRTLLTLAIGGAFYAATALTPQTKVNLRQSLRWLYAGLALALFWGSLQAVYVIHFSRPYFEFLSRLQTSFSVLRLFEQRISGMTLEPSWFGEQIAFLLMPFLFASLISRYSVFRWRWKGVTIEALLLIWATGVLVFTFSRIGLALFVGQLVLVLLFRPGRQGRALVNRIPWRAMLKRFGQVVLALVVLVGVLMAVGSKSNYFARMWTYFTDERATGSYFQYIAFSQRFTYWGTAYQIFEDYPWMGVGLGTYTFYFDDYMIDQPLTPSPELLTKLVPELNRNRTSTSKSFFPRLLAETGVVGTGIFIAFLLVLLGYAIFLASSSDAEARFWGRAGLLGWILFFAVTLSYDSFSVPNIWIVFGLNTAAFQIFSVAHGEEAGQLKSPGQLSVTTNSISEPSGS